jgi:hypothetical protein
MNRLPEFNGAAPRITSADTQRYKGQYVTIVGKPYELAVEGLFMHDICTMEKVTVVHYTGGEELAQVNEFVVYVNPANGALVYHSHGTFNDDFDAESYKKLLELIPKHPGIF